MHHQFWPGPPHAMGLRRLSVRGNRGGGGRAALAAAAGVALLGLCGGARAAGPETGLVFAQVTADGVAAGLRHDGDGGEALTAYTFAAGRTWPALRMRRPEPADWRGAAALQLPVENPAAAPFELLLRLDDRPDATGDDASLSGLVSVPPHSRVDVLLPLGAAPPGLRGRPPTGLTPHAEEVVVGQATGSVDLRHVVALHISGTTATASPRTLLIGVPRLRPRSAPEAASPVLSDRFGQYAGAAWPEKVTTVADLQARLRDAAADARRLAASVAGRRGAAPPPPVPGAATGFFRTAKLGRRWALLDPAGRPFLSLGVDAVRPDNPTVVTGREQLFAALPGAGDPLARFYGETGGRRTFDIGRADLRLGLGPGWAARWPAQTVERLRAWGFNTLGAWSAADIAPSLPHVRVWDVEGESASIPMGARSLPDPFDPRFPAIADAVAAAMTAGAAEDANLIGYFSGNEYPWGEADQPGSGLTAHVLALEPGSPARTALMAMLRARHATAAAFAAAWGLPPGTRWDDRFAVPAHPAAGMLADAARFERALAERYFGTVAAALKRHDPHHLYLGTRFGAATPAVVAACARFCDVLSFNVYGPTPTARAALWRAADRPVLIGEFHFGSLDRGSFWAGMAAVGAEAERGPAYAAYLAAAVADPQVVGVHWYQYADEPLTGRPFDGENGHIGLVAVTDVPYRGFVAAVALANAQAQQAFGRAVFRQGP